MSRTDKPPRPRFGHLPLVVVGILAALVAGLFGPTGSAQARPTPASQTTIPSAPAPLGETSEQRACCSHPDPPHTRGVPYRWCVRHHTCWEAHQFVARQVERFKHRHRGDGVTHRTMPDRFERKVRRLFAHRGCGARCTKTSAALPTVKTLLSSRPAKRDSGGYDDWVDAADCVVHGYGCYYPTYPRPELSRVEKTILWCGGTVVVAGLPGGWVTLGEAVKACFWGAAFYWMEFWK